METEEQRKDSERLERYIVRESLISILNNTKWDKFVSLMLAESDRKPAWRVRCLRDQRTCEPQWDRDWNYHLPPYKYIEWLEIYPITTERLGYLLDDKTTVNTQYFVELLKENNIPFSIEGESLRIWGYQWPGQSIIFV